jgi:prophage regulatory protein
MTLLAERARAARFLRMPDVVEKVGLSQATINRLHRRGEFPQKRSLSERCVGWWESDIAAWLESRPEIASRN